jgi:hypothetical protein
MPGVVVPLTIRDLRRGGLGSNERRAASSCRCRNDIRSANDAAIATAERTSMRLECQVR